MSGLSTSTKLTTAVGLFLVVACRPTSDTWTISGTDDISLDRGQLVTVRGRPPGAERSPSSDVEMVHLLIVGPDNRIRSASMSSARYVGTDARYVMDFELLTGDGRTVHPNTVLLLEGEQIRIGDRPFPLEAGNLFLVYPRVGPDSVRQIRQQLRDRVSPAERLAVFQRATPDDSLVQAMEVR